ncbi:hypothetical protein H2248_008204 [Termitomyces sp. 'cryptogamus']|nr:hypothetical protein H2248_008204 [Termitomyces sp. 'cryptogamus']
MMTDEFTQLVIPQPVQVSINPIAKECPSDGFNYPKFRQLNKQERVKLSTKPYQHQPNTLYVLFAVANSKGWFAAVTLQDDGTHPLVFSPLADLRAAFKSAKDGLGTFTPQRTIRLNPQKPTIISFANNDTRLFIAFEGGELLVYDTAAIFTAGNDSVNPTHALPSTRGPIRALAPNPGPEPNLLEFLAAVHSDNTVVLYNMKLEVQGGWSSTSGNVPVAVAWSPKGKHIAIGLQSGDILTYPLTNRRSVHKHVPPTNQSPLTSLDWLTPGHTFRTTYGGPGIDPVQHIVCFEPKTPTATYYSPNFPFPASERSNQSYILALQKWDEEAGMTESKSLVVVADKASIDIEILGNVGTQWYQESQENPLSLPLNDDQGDTLLLGLAVDLTDEQVAEPVMYAYLDDGTVQAWHLEHSKPYSGMIMSKPVAVAAPTPAPSAFSQPAPAISVPSQVSSAFGQPSTFGQTSTPTSTFGQPSAFGAQVAPAFGTTGFTQKTTSAFGQPSAFGQASSSSAFGAQPAFGQTSQPTSAFSNLQTQSSPFGQPANPSMFAASSGAFDDGSSGAFSGGSSGAFGRGSSGAFGGASSGAFGGGSPSGGAFSGGAFGGNTNVFGSSSFGAAEPSNTFGGGGNSFAALANNTSVHNVFGQGSFGASSSSSSSAPAPEMSREESMSDDTPSLGGMGLGAPNDSLQPAKSGGIFGSFATNAAPSEASTSFSGLIKPASGAFSNFSTNTTTDQKPAPEQAPASAQSTMTKPASGFGQPSFGGSSFGQQPAFGQSSFGKPASAVGGGFGAFASAPTSFASAAKQSGIPSSGGFGAFASSAATPFGAAPASTTSPPASGSFTTAASPFAPAGSGDSGTGSAFGSQPDDRTISSEKEDEANSPIKASAKLVGSPPSSPDATPRLGKASLVSVNDKPSEPSTPSVSTTPAASPFGKVAEPTSGAFANLVTTPSVFKPATGFGAFGSDKIPSSSPFFNVNANAKGPTASGLPAALAGSPSSIGVTSASASPAFGSASALGAPRSVFPIISSGSPTPAKAPTTGGFGAFSGTSTGFGAFAGPKMSFDQLLKVGDNDLTDPVKPGTSTNVEAEKPKPVSVFQIINNDASALVFTPPKEPLKSEDTLSSSSLEVKGKSAVKEDLFDEPSFGNLSTISVASSFTEVSLEESDEHDAQSGSEDAEADRDGFLSDDLEVEEGEIEDEEESESDEEPSQLSDVPEEDEEEEEEEPEEEGHKNKDTIPEPTAVPLPRSRSSSVTPQPEVPEVQVTPSPPPETSPQKVQEESTTPPGTPPKEVTPLPIRPVPIPAPCTTPSTPFVLGLGRPSTRPTRSSPLASSTVSLADNEEAPPSPAKPLVSPQPRVAALPTRNESDEDATSSSKLPRPKTPPLLSAFGSLKSTATPATPSTPATPPTPVTPPTPATPPTPVTPTLTAAQTSPTIPATPAFGALVPQTAPGVTPLSTNSSLSGNIPTRKTVDTPTTQLPTPSQTSGPVAAPSAPSLTAPSPNAPSPSASSNFFGKTFTLPNAADKAKGKEGDPSSGSLLPGNKVNVSIPAAMPPPIDLGGKNAPAVTPAPVPATPPPFNLSGFSLKPPATSAITPPFSPSAPSLSTPAAVATTPNLSGLGIKPPVPSVITPSLSPSAPSLSTLAAVAATSEKPSVNVPTEAGLQRECMLVYTTVAEDLAFLGVFAEQRKKGLATLQARGNMPRTRADFADPRDWSPASSLQFGRILVQFEKDLDELRDIRLAQHTQLKEIQSNALKAKTRKEEIGRFDRAKNDKEFAKMLRARSLGPEHLETQAQLRRAIRVIRDRVQTLEDHLRGSKKKLTQVKTGRPSIRPPSLDSINRTYRNINIALGQQAAQIALLKKRFTKLRSSPELSTSGPSSLPSYPKRDPRLPSPQSSRRSTVTPDVAVTTAAALNAERAAHRLKRALLQVRSAPLLNTAASLAPAPPLSFNTPQKEVRPVWTPPERRGATGGRKHGVIPFGKKTASPGSHGSSYSGDGSTAAPAFNWGPLPSFDYEKKGESFTMVEAVKITPPRR